MGLTFGLITESGNRRGTNEEREVGNSALAFRLIRNGNRFNSVELRQNLNAYRGRIRVNGETDNAGRRIPRDRSIRVGMHRFQSTHEENQKDTA